MALGMAVRQLSFEHPAQVLGDRLATGSIYRLLSDEGKKLFPDDYFGDCYKASVRGRLTIPARVMATAMLLQSFEGLSDRETTDRLDVDLRWQAAAGLPTGAESFHPTVLVGMRNRLRASDRPKRLVEDTVALAKGVGIVGSKLRVIDSTPLYDAVATQDTVPQLRAAIRQLLRLADQVAPELARPIRLALRRDDAYATPGKPPCTTTPQDLRVLLPPKTCVLRNKLLPPKTCVLRNNLDLRMV